METTGYPGLNCYYPTMAFTDPSASALYSESAACGAWGGAWDGGGEKRVRTQGNEDGGFIHSTVPIWCKKHR